MVIEEDFNFNMLKTFYAVAKSKSFSSASNELFISQPAVSYSIKKLEDYYGTPLFERGVKGLTLTKAGEALLPIVEIILNNISKCKSTVKQVNNLSLGTLKIGIQSHIYGMIREQVAKFIQKYNNLTLNFIEDSTSNLIAQLEKGDIDLIIDIPPISSKNPYITLEPLKEVELCLAYNPSKQTKDLHKVPLSELVQMRFIVPLATTTRRKILDSYLNSKGLAIQPTIEASSTNIIIDTVKETDHIGLLFKENIQDEIDQGLLDIITFTNDTKKMKLCALYNQSTTALSVKEFIKQIKEN